MSVREASAAMYARVSPSAKLVLIFMGEACGDDDDCHVGIDFLVAMTGMSPEKVRMVIEQLQTEGLITHRGRSLHDDRLDAYWIHTDRLDARRIEWRRDAQAGAHG